MMLFLTALAIGVATTVAIRVMGFDSVSRFFIDQYARLFPRRPMSRRALIRRLPRLLRSAVTVGVTGRVLVPSTLAIVLHSEDLLAVAGMRNWLAGDLARYLRDEAARRDWDILGDLRVIFRSDDSRPVGTIAVESRFEPGTARDTETVVPDGLTARLDEEPTMRLSSEVSGPSHRTQTFSSWTLTPLGGGPEVFIGSDGLVVIGRAPDCQLRVTDVEVSRRHCRLRSRPDGALELCDLDSTNGTYLGSRRISGPVLVRAGGEIRLSACTAWKVKRVSSASCS